MRQLMMRGFLVSALGFAVAGCAGYGYDGPRANLYAYQGAYVEIPGFGLPCYPNPQYFVPGRPGPAGPAGRVGAAGPAGPTGPAGVQGLAGVQGPVGMQGSVGMQGPVGTQGPVGMQGPAGPLGRQGSAEVRGYPAIGGRWAWMENIQFEPGRADIQPKCADKIAQLARWINENRQLMIGLDSHSEDARTNDNDPTLSARRVQAVRHALMAAGITGDRISAGAFGARLPVCREATDECRALNRRVEVLALRR